MPRTSALTSGGQASTSGQRCFPRSTALCPCLLRTDVRSRTHSAPSQLLQHLHQPHLGHVRPCVTAAARQRGRGGPGSDRSKGRLEININGQEYELSNTSIALLAASALGLALIVGPLIMGVVVATVAVGAAFSFGAFAFSMLWWPLAALMGFMAFSFLLPFGAFATFGLGLFFPKLLSMAIAGAGLAFGWYVVQNILPQRTSATGATDSMSSMDTPLSSRDARGSEVRPGYNDGPVLKADSKTLNSQDDDEIRRQSRELRDFDEMLAEREEQRRVDEWRKRSSG